MAPNRRLNQFFAEKTSKVTLFSLSEVFCGPQKCQKCVGGRGREPRPPLDCSRCSSRPPSQLGPKSPPPRRLNSRTFSTPLLWPLNVKSRLRPWCLLNLFVGWHSLSLHIITHRKGEPLLPCMGCCTQRMPFCSKHSH